MQRFTFKLLLAYKTKRIVELVYNSDKGLTAFIEVRLPFLPSPLFHIRPTSFWWDYYASSLPLTSTPSQFIEDKFGVTMAHLGNATLFSPEQLYISFTSAAAIVVGGAEVDMTPKVGCGYSLVLVSLFFFFPLPSCLQIS